jgi:glycosyltransferase involved in cell wall biosynthesis
MRILICAHEAPLPPTNGFRLQVSALVGELRRHHEVRLLSFLTPDQDADGGAPDGMRLLPHPIAGPAGKAFRYPEAVLRRRPWGVDRLAAAIRGPLREEIREFRPDIVHVSSGRLAALGPDLRDVPSVLAALDAWYVFAQAEVDAAAGLKRRLLRGQAARLRRFESTAYRAFGRVVVVSEQDRQALLALDPTLAVDVIPNGVDIAAFAPDPGVRPDPNRVIFTGVMSYTPNVVAAEFLAREIMPRVRTRCPDARLAIVGRSPSPRVRALASEGDVQVVGEVPHLRPWLAGSRAYACPMTSGTGIKNKLLEALAAGVPCVATPLAVQGLSAQPGRHILVGTNEEELAGHLVRVLSDDDLARSLGRAGRDYVTAEHSWEAVARAYERVYREVRTSVAAG